MTSQDQISGDAPGSPVRRTRIVAVLNVTPDSFSGDGLDRGDCESPDLVEAVVARAGQCLADGADILDIGGESTRPGSTPLDADAEAARVVPAIAAVRRSFPDATISVDTYKAEVARQSLDAGADMINDVWAGGADPDMLPLAAFAGVPVVLMHNSTVGGRAQIDPRLGGVYEAPAFDDFLSDVCAELDALAHRALAAGVRRENIILDPGIGFGKSVRQNLALINRADRIRALGYPILLGCSRKGFIGRVLDVGADDRLEGTAAAVAVGVVRGADLVRVHDVRAMVRIARMTEALLRADGT